MEARSAHHNGTASTHPPYWCDDCKRAHNGTDVDRRALLGDRGILRNGYAYAYAERCGEYHYRSVHATDRIPRRNMGAKHRVIAHTRLVNAAIRNAGTRPVRVTSNAADAFVRAYDAQRSRHQCIGGATMRDVPRSTLALA